MTTWRPFLPMKRIAAGWRSSIGDSMRPRSCPGEPLPKGLYSSSDELVEDVRIIQRSLSGAHNDLLVQGEIQRWIDQIQTFGLHLARLDVRQDARDYEAVMGELLAQAGVAADYVAMSEVERQQILLETLGKPLSWEPAALSEAAQKHSRC